MRRIPVAPRAGAHPADEALASLLDDEEETGPPARTAALRAHVARCPVCTRRLEELRALRGWLREGALAEAEPSRDLARQAVVRLRQRQAAVGGVNELLATLATFLRWLAVLLAAPPPRPGPERSGEAAGGSGA
jgi:anti-sigma factor RsiW